MLFSLVVSARWSKGTANLHILSVSSIVKVPSRQTFCWIQPAPGISPHRSRIKAGREGCGTSVCPWYGSRSWSGSKRGVYSGPDLIDKWWYS